MYLCIIPRYKIESFSIQFFWEFFELKNAKKNEKNEKKYRICGFLHVLNQ